MPGYLEHLAVRMAVQAAQLPEPLRNLHRDFALQKQNPDGGFAGRDGESDLYYTSFGLRVLSMFGALYGEPAEKSAAYLRQCLQGRESVVDFLTLIYSAALLDMSAGLDVFESAASGWQQRILEQLESFRRPDGGYAKGPQGAAGSTYHSFLVVICQQLLQAPTPQPERLAEFLLSQRDETGGFREIRAAKRGSTNPSAAAIAVLKILDRLDESVAAEAIAFLAQMQNEEGGLRQYADPHCRCLEHLYGTPDAAGSRRIGRR